jgi:hypothetical protein
MKSSQVPFPLRLLESPLHVSISGLRCWFFQPSNLSQRSQRPPEDLWFHPRELKPSKFKNIWLMCLCKNKMAISFRWTRWGWKVKLFWSSKSIIIMPLKFWIDWWDTNFRHQNYNLNNVFDSSDMAWNTQSMLRAVLPLLTSICSFDQWLKGFTSDGDSSAFRRRSNSRWLLRTRLLNVMAQSTKASVTWAMG